MPSDYRKPGVYVEETLLTGAADLGTASTTFLFVGAAPKGRSLDPVRIESWSDFESEFGSIGDKVKLTVGAGEESADYKVTNYLPYAVYSFFQNGGRRAYVQRAFSASNGGAVAELPVTGLSLGAAFTVVAKSAGEWGNTVQIATSGDGTGDALETGGNEKIFSLQVFLGGALVETFTGLSTHGVTSGTKTVAEVVNDPVYGSKYIRIADFPAEPVLPGSGSADYTNLALSSDTALEGGVDPSAPSSAELESTLSDAVSKIEGALVAAVAGYLDDVGDYVGIESPEAEVLDRGDVIFVDDFVQPRTPGTAAATYATDLINGLGTRNPGTSYVAAYAPWLIVANPGKRGSTITVPPAGAVMGVMARNDATRGVFRAPAGIEAVVTNAVGVDAKFSDSDLGALNNKGVNIIRPVTGRGICIMGARTRKRYAADRYISARRTLIYLREALRNGTEFALFENNDELLWSRMTGVADRILRPVWSGGGLRGNSAEEAYFVRCDATINTPATIAAGEVRMDIGVALEYPAEFVVIRLTQFEQGGSNIEIQQNQ